MQTLAGNPHLMVALCQPKFVLRRALDAVISEIASAIKQQPENQIAFVLTHAVYYLGDRQEFVFLLGESTLERLAPDAVVTLTDDIYDVFSHLSRPGEIFGYSSVQSIPRELHTIISLLYILHWREQEFSFSEHLASELGLPHILLATKHPAETLAQWLFTDRKCVYLSHPITELRAGIDSDDETAVLTARTINRLYDVLQASENCVVFAPTTIDELRFADVPGALSGAGGLMLKRWPLLCDSADSLLYAPSSPGGLDLDQVFREASEPTSAVLLETLKVLRNAILQQISFRDRVLVDQSDGLFLWRPYYGGRLSTGMYAELEHLVALQKKDPENSRFAVIHVGPQEEWAHFLANELVGEFGVQLDPLPIARFLASGEARELWRQYKQSPEALTQVDAALAGRGIYIGPGPKKRGALSGAPEVQRRLIWRHLIDKHSGYRQGRTSAVPNFSNDISSFLMEFQESKGKVVKNLLDDPGEQEAVSDLRSIFR